MGLFDKMFGSDAQEEAAEQFGTLKSKYQSVLSTIENEDVRLHNLHVEGEKLVIKGEAPNEDAKNKVWDQIKLVDAAFNDLHAEIAVNPNLGVTDTANATTYTVQSGDSLSKIAQEQLGNSNEYMKIFYANRDKLSDPNMIQVGQELVIPKG